MKASEQYLFTAQIPGNAFRLKLALINLVCVIGLCVIGIIVAKYFWEDYTYMTYSYKAQAYIRQGWPAVVNSWSWILGVACLIALPFMYFMQDWRNPALGLTAKELFINQQLIRNTLVPFSNIEKIEKSGKDYLIKFYDNNEIVKQQVFIFKPMVRSNLQNGQFFISGVFNAGDIDTFMKLLESKITKKTT